MVGCSGSLYGMKLSHDCARDYCMCDFGFSSKLEAGNQSLESTAIDCCPDPCGLYDWLFSWSRQLCAFRYANTILIYQAVLYLGCLADLSFSRKYLMGDSIGTQRSSVCLCFYR